MSAFTAMRPCHLLSGLQIDLVSNYFEVHRNSNYAAGKKKNMSLKTLVEQCLREAVELWLFLGTCLPKMQ